MNPANQLREGDSQRIVERAVNSGGHDFVAIFEARPIDLFALNHGNAHPDSQWNLNSCASHLAVAHRRVPITHIEQRAANIHGKVERVAYARFRRAHVAAKFRRYYRTAGLAARRSHSDAT